MAAQTGLRRVSIAALSDLQRDLGESVAEHFPLRLAGSRMLAPSVRHMAFERADGTPFAFIPGQFVQVHFNYADGKPTKRSYSVATVGAGDGVPVQHIEMAVSYVEGGAATDLLGHLEQGQNIDGSGPYGRFCLMDADSNKRYLLVATGTGVTPYRAMLPQIEKPHAARATCKWLSSTARAIRSRTAVRRRIRGVRATESTIPLLRLLLARGARASARARPRAAMCRSRSTN